MTAIRESWEAARRGLPLTLPPQHQAMFGMQDPIASGSELTIMVVDHPSLAAVLRMAFNAYWDQGVDFEEAAARTPAEARQTGAS